VVRYLGAIQDRFRQAKSRFPDNPKISNQTVCYPLA
jgi:hypothetical protein